MFGIVRQSRGAIDVATAPEQGTTFQVLLPVSDATAADRESSVETTSTAAPPGTILLAEDEEGVRAFLETALKRGGHNVISAESGPEAVAKARAAGVPIDLLITDVVMPGLSGPEVAAQVTQMFPHMRVIFLSGYATHASLPASLSADATTFLQKPFTVDGLMTKVRERLSHK